MNDLWKLEDVLDFAKGALALKATVSTSSSPASWLSVGLTNQFEHRCICFQPDGRVHASVRSMRGGMVETGYGWIGADPLTWHTFLLTSGTSMFGSTRIHFEERHEQIEKSGAHHG